MPAPFHHRPHWPARVAFVAAALAAAIASVPRPAASFAPRHAALAPVAPEDAAVQVPPGNCPPAPDAAGNWVFASQLDWESARTGWQAIVDVVVPERDAASSRNPLVVAGTNYDHGLGTYPTSEIIYALDGQYTAFHALAGLNADSSPRASVVFQIYADGALIFNSGAVGMAAPVPVDVCVGGVRRLRLVTAPAGQRTPWIEDRPLDQVSAFADWADARLFRPPPGDAAAAAAAGTLRPALDAYAEARRTHVVGEMGVYQQDALSMQQAVAGGLGLDPAQPQSWPAQTQGVRDPAGNVLLVHRRLALMLGLGQPGQPGQQGQGLLSALVPGSSVLTLTRADSAVRTSARAIGLSADTVLAAPDAVSFTRVDDPALGAGTQARVSLRLRDPASGNPLRDGPSIELRLTLFDDRPSFTYQLLLDGWPESPPADAGSTGVGSPTRLDYLSAGGDSGAASLVVGDAAGYFADAGYARAGTLADDGLWHVTRIGLGKPAVLWGDALPGAGGTGGSVVMAELDEQRLPAWLVTRRDPAHAATVAGIAQPLPAPALTGRPESAAPGGHVDGPRLLVQFADTQDLRSALGDYRRITAALYPPAPLPDWLRYQWGSWWVYGSGIDEEKIRRQIDVIAGELSDLGPWHILIDAGWEDIGPDGGDDLGQENRSRFPHGLRTLVDYAHARGIKVILFYSAVYAHDGSDKGEWLGLPRLISEHSGWFIPLTPSGVTPARYLFDYRNPGTHDYLASVLHRYVTDYDADGVKIDGLGDVEGSLIPLRERVLTFPQRWALTPVMDIYRTVAQTVRQVKPDAFVESGWVDPVMAQPYAQTFRSGDEWNVFDHGYPFPGLAQHFAYAAIQQGLLGQRPNIGAVYGGLEKPLARQWLGAALATGAQVSLGSDLTALTADQLATVRGWLAPERPFAGSTRTGPQPNGAAAEWTATANGDVVTLARLNSNTVARSIPVTFGDLGLAGGPPALAYDPETDDAQLTHDAVTTAVPPQTLQTLVLRQTAGPVWSTSSLEALPTARGWKLMLRGPQNIPGALRFYAPGLGANGPSAVLLDGRPLEKATPPGAAPPASGQPPAQFSYDSATGLLTVDYAHAGLAAPGAVAPGRLLEIVP